MTAAWPELVAAEWQDTRDTLHMWTQMAGKVALALAPPVNHWWATTLHTTAEGLATGVLPYGDRSIQLAFDFHSDRLAIDTSAGEHREIALEPRSVADFYREFRTKLDELHIAVTIYPRPVEVAEAIPFAEDETHASYDRDAVARFHHVLVATDDIFAEFRSRFVGKSSPVHFFWGGFDVAVTRFSGRTAPTHQGGAPNCPQYVQEAAYSHEVSSAGYWPSGDGEGIFYSYAYPEPAGYKERPVAPAAASYDSALGEFVLPVTAVRTATDPRAELLAFLQSTYEAAAECAGWDRAALEATPLSIPGRKS